LYKNCCVRLKICVYLYILLIIENTRGTPHQKTICLFVSPYALHYWPNLSRNRDCLGCKVHLEMCVFFLPVYHSVVRTPRSVAHSFSVVRSQKIFQYICRSTGAMIGKYQGLLTFSRLMIYIYICRTAPLTSRRYILYIYSTNIRTEYFKHVAHSPFFPLQNAVYFNMLPFLVPVLFTF
jgi:hypothetical protein